MLFLFFTIKMVGFVMNWNSFSSLIFKRAVARFVRQMLLFLFVGVLFFMQPSTEDWSVYDVRDNDHPKSTIVRFDALRWESIWSFSQQIRNLSFQSIIPSAFKMRLLSKTYSIDNYTVFHYYISIFICYI